MDSKFLVLSWVFALVSLSVEGLGVFALLDPRETNFYLFTPSLPSHNGEIIHANSLHAIRDTTFDPSLRLAVIIHGFQQHGSRPWIRKMRQEIMKKEKMNILVVDWETRAGTPNYLHAAENTPIVGRQLADLITEIHHHFQFNPSKIHVIGHSLGAHVAGFAGANLRMRNHTRLGRITGLDPARPEFDVDSPDERLDPSDAVFVDVIHTDLGFGYNYLKGGLGLARVSGHVDFYPNGGASQPGCSNFGLNFEDNLRKIEIFSQRPSVSHFFACDHMKVIDYFTSSINHQCSRKAFPCENWEAFKQGRCFECHGACPQMGYNADQYHVNGSHKYYLATYDEEDYCAPEYYASVVLSGLRTKKEFWFFDALMNTVKTKKIGISLVRQDGRKIQAPSRELEDASQINRLVLSDHQPGPLSAIILTYSGSQEMYIDKATVHDQDNTYTACFKTWISSDLFGFGRRYWATLRRGDHAC